MNKVCFDVNRHLSLGLRPNIDKMNYRVSLLSAWKVPCKGPLEEAC